MEKCVWYRRGADAGDTLSQGACWLPTPRGMSVCLCLLTVPQAIWLGRKRKPCPVSALKKYSLLNLVGGKSGHAEPCSNSGKLVTDKSQWLRKCCWAPSTCSEVGRTQRPHSDRRGLNTAGDRCRAQSFLYPATNIFEHDWPHHQFLLGQQWYTEWDFLWLMAKAGASGFTALTRHNRAGLEVSGKYILFWAENCK